MRTRNESGRTSETLLKVHTSSVSVELRRNIYRHQGGDTYRLKHPVVEMSFSGRPATGEIYFRGKGGDIGGMVGRLIFLPSAIPMDARWQAGAETSLICEFSNAAASRFPDLSEAELANAISLSSPRMLAVMTDIREELERKNFHYETVVEGYALQLAGLLARHFEMYRHSGRLPRPDRLPRAQFEEVVASLHGRRGTPRMRELANELGYSEGHFSRLFQATVGCSFTEYVVAKKMAWAEEILRSTAIPIKEIAFELGYEVSADFSRAFRSHGGISPREYRRTRH